MSSQSVQLHVGSPGATYSDVSTDAPKQLAAVKLFQDGVDHSSDPDGTIKRAVSFHITTETAGIRIGFGGATVSTVLGHLYPAGSIINLASWSEILDFRFISAVALTPATLQITPYY